MSVTPVFTAIGVFSLASQALLFREYLTSFRGNEFGIALFFGTWLFWIAVGALSATALGRRVPLGRLFLPATALYPAVAALQSLVIIRLRSLSGVEPFELFPLGTLFLTTWLVNAPVSLVTGFVYTAGCVFASGQSARDKSEHAEAGGQLAARLYAWEALGSFAGGLGVTGLLWYSVPSFTVFALASGALLLACLVAALAARSRLAVSLAGALLAVLVLGFVPPTRAGAEGFLAQLRWAGILPEARLLTASETPYHQVSIAELPGQKVFLANGQVVATSAEGNQRAVQAALLVAQCPWARRILVIGLGSQALVPAMLRYDVQQLDVLSIDEKYHRAVLAHYPASVRRAFADPRVRARFGDARGFLGRTPGDRYDLILVDLPDPDTAALNRFFTVEFFRSARRALRRRGVLALGITAGENYAGTDVMQYGRSVFQSLKSVFPQVVVTPGESAWLFASPSKRVVTLDAAVLQERFSKMARRDQTVPPQAFGSLIPAERIDATSNLFRQTGGQAPEALLNSDDRPLTFFLSLLVSGKRAGMAMGAPLRAARGLGLILFVVPIFVFLALRLYHRATTPYRGATSGAQRALAFNASMLLAVIGAVSMSLSVVLSIAFQNRFGHLFVSVGLLSALFMLGLFVGGLGGRRMLRAAKGGPALWPAHSVLALASGICLSVPWLTGVLGEAERGAALLGYHGLFWAVGSCCGLAFPVAGRYLEQTGRDTGLVAGLLEALDHWGAALGAGFAGLLVFPVLGLSGCCAWLFCCLVAVWLLFAIEQLALSRRLSSFPGYRRFERWLDHTRRRQGPGGMRSLGFAVAGILIATGLISNLLADRLEAPRVHLDREWIAARYRAALVEERPKPFVHYLAKRAPGKAFSELLFASRAVAPDIEGYAGPINLLLVMGGEERIREVVLMESRETPAYVHDFGNWLQQFEQWPLDRRIHLDENVDALTGATITARAATRILEASRVRAARQVFGHQAVKAEAAAPAARLNAESLLLLASWLVAVLLFIKARQAHRTGFLIVNLVMAGLVFNLQFSTAHVLRIATFDLPSISSGELFWLVFGVLLLAVGFGQIYCGYLCPFGAAQELLARLGLIRRPNREGGGIRRTKFVLLALVLLGFFVSRSPRVADFDPLQAAFSFSYTGWMPLLLLTIGVFSALYFRFWCRYLCPVGAFLSLFNRIGVLLRLSPPKAYSDCDLGMRSKWDMDCIQCNRCIERRRQRSEGEVAPSARQVPAGERSAPPGEQADTVPAAQRENAAANARAGGRLGIWMRDTWNAVLLAAVALTAALCLALAWAGPAAEAADSLGQPRDLDVAEIQKQIQQQRLSDREALFYRLVEDGDDAASETPTEPVVPLR